MNISHTIAILAYNNHELTKINLQHLINQGYRENILLFDNGSNPSYENLAIKLNIKYIRENINIYVNPAWNWIVENEESSFLTLLNNDCFILSENYFHEIIHHMHKNKIGLTSCKTKNIKKLPDDNFLTNNYFLLPKENRKLSIKNNARRQGWLMTLNLKTYRMLDCKIPEYIKIWYGDDWIWSQYHSNNIISGVYENRYAIHVKNSSSHSSAINQIIKEDEKNLLKHGDWHRKLSSKFLRRTRIFSRYI